MCILATYYYYQAKYDPKARIDNHTLSCLNFEYQAILPARIFDLREISEQKTYQQYKEHEFLSLLSASSDAYNWSTPTPISARMVFIYKYLCE